MLQRIHPRVLARALAVVILRSLGGPGSGNFGHAGRPGEVGGSAPSDVPEGILAAIQQADGGFTYRPATGESPKTGFALSLHKDRERIVPAKDVNLVTLAEYARDNDDLLSQPGNYMGGWNNPQDGKVYLDVSTVVDSAVEAEILGSRADQLAYFDLSRGESVPIERKRVKAATAYLEWPSGYVGGFDRDDATDYWARANTGRNRESTRDSRETGRRTLGGPGSGHHGHAGRPGEVGGSAPAGEGGGKAPYKSMESIPADVRKALRDNGANPEPRPPTPEMTEGFRQAVETARAVNPEIAKKMEEVGIVVAAYNPPGAGMTTVGDMRTGESWVLANANFNPHDQNLNERAWKQAEQYGTIPTGSAKAQRESGVAAGLAMAYAHEMGHVYDNSRQKTRSERLTFDMMERASRGEDVNKIILGLSGYATASPGEAYAEAFSMALHGWKLPKEFEWIADDVKHAWREKTAPKKRAAMMTAHAMPFYVIPGTPWSFETWVKASSPDVIEISELETLGGPGSGHFDHAGRPGEVGGSLPSSGSSQVEIELPDPVELARDREDKSWLANPYDKPKIKPTGPISGIEAVERYSSGESMYNNAELRLGKNLEDLGGFAEDLKALDRQMAPSEKPQELYRLLSARRADTLEVGDEFVDRGFMSTTKTQKAFEQIVDDVGLPDEYSQLVIHAPKGTKQVDVNETIGRGHDYSHQHEVILARDTKFRVISAVKNDSPPPYKVIHVRVIQ